MTIIVCLILSSSQASEEIKYSAAARHPLNRFYIFFVRKKPSNPRIKSEIISEQTSEQGFQNSE